jgi:probable H4MPT-linked C1 transfer pathway protein
MAVTMTAELADCFATKGEGVAAVLDAIRAAFPRTPIRVFGTDGRFRSPDEAVSEPSLVAAANWMASALVVARHLPDALFVDVGSTTTDIIPIARGRVVAVGRTDTARLQSGELIYTGALRTPVAAVVRWVPLNRGRCRVAAELFANTADVHRWLDRIQEHDYTCETPDGRGRSRRDAAARIARMVCADLAMLSDADITRIAAHVAEAQVRRIAAAVRAIARRHTVDLAVVAGAGKFLAMAAAGRAGLAVRDLAEDFGPAVARATPAAAVAWLLAETAASGLLRR